MKNKVSRLNKKGQDLSIGTLILIVLGIVVLVLLILGFTLGWGELWNKINIFGGTSSIGDVTTACRLAHTSQDTYTLCERTWDVKNSTGDPEKGVSCQSLKNRGLLDLDFTCERGCRPDETECAAITAMSECTGPCTQKEITGEDGTTTTTCGLAQNALTTCAEKNNNVAGCNAIKGCKYTQ